MPSLVTIRRLGADDPSLAAAALQTMHAVFDEPVEPLPPAYIAALLARDDFWLVAAFDDGAPVGAITAHRLPMTRAATSELFIYDLAVAESHQRRGIGRALVASLREAALAAGIGVAFVPADDEDDHALAFYRAIGGAAAPVTIFTFDADADADAPVRG